MKKSEKAKLDAKWWKKNKSVRLKSKAFDQYLADYVGARGVVDIQASSDALKKAVVLAKAARKEAGALAGKCGKFQEETKAVLLDYTTLLSGELSQLSKIEVQHKADVSKVEKILATLLARIKTQRENISLHSKAAAQATSTAKQMIPSRSKELVEHCKGRIQKLEASIKELGMVIKDLDALTTMKGRADVKNGAAISAKIKNTALGHMELARQTEKHFRGLIEQAMGGAPSS